MKELRRRWPLLVVFAAAVVLVVGLVRVFQLRFRSGDVYPPYSTFRADPLGTKALFEALSGVGLEVSRNLRSLAHVPLPQATTVYVTGIDWDVFADTETNLVRSLMDTLENGGRLVIAFAPSAPPDEALNELLETIERLRRQRRDEAGERSRVLLPDAFGVGVNWLQARPSGAFVAERVAANEDLPASLPWSSALSFEARDPGWRVLYEVGNLPVILEREYGRGTLVLLGDAYHLSNEALWGARSSHLVAWLQGPHTSAIFDESLLGVRENRGVATLARHYRLDHMAFALIAIALLYIWRQTSSLIPARELAALNAGASGGEARDEFAGRETAAGFVNLLRRTVSAREFFPAALHEFRHSAAWRRLGTDTRAELERLGAEEQSTREPLAAVRAAHAVLARKR